LGILRPSGRPMVRTHRLRRCWIDLEN
jgi:hypothetical protein